MKTKSKSDSSALS